MEKPPGQEPDFSRALRWGVGLLAAAGLLALFMFQRYDWSALTGGHFSPIQRFLLNRSVRFVLNDLLAMLLVLAVFGKRKYVIVAIFVQVLSFVFILLPYFFLKLSYPGYNGPLISFLHRLVLNPVLIYLLMFFFWYQEKQSKN
jgi:exosortase F-associated protein